MLPYPTIKIHQVPPKNPVETPTRSLLWSPPRAPGSQGAASADSAEPGLALVSGGGSAGGRCTDQPQGEGTDSQPSAPTLRTSGGLEEKEKWYDQW